jgi:two-component system, NarL family, nitrate/nitrite response regulator NarL
MRILIADDNEPIRRAVKAIVLSDSNCEVCGEAVDGLDVLRKARELLPDVILLDISMPAQNGLEAARLLRHELPKVKIIVMSHHDPIRLLPGATEAGAQACVDKSRLGSDLLATIDRVLA